LKLCTGESLSQDSLIGARTKKVQLDTAFENWSFSFLMAASREYARRARRWRL
jgi:hypothetical protein